MSNFTWNIKIHFAKGRLLQCYTYLADYQMFTNKRITYAVLRQKQCRTIFEKWQIILRTNICGNVPTS